MSTKIFLKQFLILFFFFSISHSLTCGENEIEGCKGCGTGTNSSLCKTCEDKYFLVLEGEKCIKCDDELFGMKGCDGNCIMMKSEKNVKCEENKCKEGFYEIEPGYCAICSLLFYGCSKCTFLSNGEEEEKEFNCLECVYDYYYPSLYDNKCRYCSLSNCDKCLNETFCEKCSTGYALYPNGTCIYLDNHCNITIYSEEKKAPICLECKNYYALYPNGSCISEDYYCIKPIYSEGKSICQECDDGYALYPNGKCIYFGYNCKQIIYSESKGKGICVECNEGYFINKNDKCSDCSSYQYDYNSKNFLNCKSCHVEENKLLCDSVEDGYYIYGSGEFIYPCSNKISNCKKCSYHSQSDMNNGILKCDECNSGTYLSSDGLSCKTCKIKENGCRICSDDETQENCDGCSSGYIQISEDTCLNCKETFGEGCSSCSFSILSLTPFCSSCYSGCTKDVNGKCIHCANDANLIGCESCTIKYNMFYCLSCKNNYVLFDGKCIDRDNEIFENCLEVKNIGKDNEIVYSCIECKYSSYIFAIKDNNAKICIEPKEEFGLKNCLLSRKENIGENNYTCIECNGNYKLVYNETKNKEICNTCKEGYYKSSNTDNFYCRYCPSNCKICHLDENSNALCDACEPKYIKTLDSKECKECPYYCLDCSFDENSEIICNEYKPPHFKKGIDIDICFNYIDNCGLCSYSENNTLKCDKCLDDYFLNKNGECEHCTINKDMGSACISCTDDEEIKKNAPCQKCNGNNYFLTKENTCIFCKSDNYGGKNCKNCGYININGIEKIGCIQCKYSFYPIIDGKCLDEYINNCAKYESYKDENNLTKYECVKCEENYFLNSDKHCRSINTDNDNSNLRISYEIIPDDDSKLIEGCLKYNINKNNNYYCISCESNYIKSQGYCFKKINNPFLDHCLTLKENGLLGCSYCSSSYSYEKYYLNSIEVCRNSYYGNCFEYENIGTSFKPIYSCKSCSNYKIIYENGVNVCSNSKFLNNRCLEVKVNTSYHTNVYTCIKCDPLYILSYSDYNERMDCKYIYEDEKTNNISNYDKDEGIATNNGKCNDGYFTRNGKVCIKCDNETIGMPGCNGKCYFELNKSIQLKCEKNNCKNNYFETLPGVCTLCSNAISKCQNCVYIPGVDAPIFKPERKRNLICIECKENYILKEGKCLSCNEYMNGCSKCLEENGKVKCNELYNGYYFDQNGEIKKCQDMCNNCTIENKDGINELKCLETYYGYYADQNGEVKKCQDNCDKCILINENGENKVKCEEANYHYFINKKGEIKLCADENEGISECTSCKFDSDLKCLFCNTGYELVDNKCESIEKLYNLEGCKNYAYIYENSTYKYYYCSSCKDDYVYINKLKICVKKQKSIEFCNDADLIKTRQKTIYNCTSCEYDYDLVRNSDGYYTCYYSYFVDELKNCFSIVNIGTREEPFLICEKCNNLYLYNYNYYSIAVDEYGNQNCQYTHLFGNQCIKGTMFHKYIYDKYYHSYSHPYIYNCTECETKYALEYDNYTEVNKCSPLECGVPFCKKCFDDDVYKCEECLKGYTFTKLGFCYIKPKVTPTITFKDIFRFSLNGLISGNILFSFSFYLRGITRNQISEKHSFIISTLFSSNNDIGFRALEDSESFETSCEFEQQMDNDSGEIKFVDYKCSLNSDKNLITDFKMESIKEGDYVDKDNLDSFNLENLVQSVDNILKMDSVHDQNELNKFILFIVDSDSKHLEVDKMDNYNFTIYGITNKIMDNKINGILTFADTNNKIAKCEIDAKNKDKALLLCNANISSILIDNPNKILSFKEQEILADKNNIYFDGLNEVEIFGFEEKNNQKSGTNVGLIVGLVIGGVALVAITILIIVLYKKRKKKIDIPNNPEYKISKIENVNNNVSEYNKKEFVENNKIEIKTNRKINSNNENSN